MSPAFSRIQWQAGSKSVASMSPSRTSLAIISQQWWRQATAARTATLPLGLPR